MSNINDRVSTPSILNPTIYIANLFNFLNIFTIPSLYELNDVFIKSNSTSTYLIISHKLNLISHINLDIIANSLNTARFQPASILP